MSATTGRTEKTNQQLVAAEKLYGKLSAVLVNYVRYICHSEGKYRYSTFRQTIAIVHQPTDLFCPHWNCYRSPHRSLDLPTLLLPCAMDLKLFFGMQSSYIPCKHSNQLVLQFSNFLFILYIPNSFLLQI